MVATTSIGALIRDNKTYRITSDIQTGSQLGMITMDAHLMSLVNTDQIDADQAIEKAQDPEEMRKKLLETGAEVTTY